MLRPERSIERVYLHRAPVDMRRQIDGLSILVREVMQTDALGGALFVFINRRRDKLKCLTWERNGFVIWCKRLERERFHWPRRRCWRTSPPPSSSTGCRCIARKRSSHAWGSHSGARPWPAG